MPRRLRFREIAPGCDFHAALVRHQGAGGGSGPLHDHDFWEAMYVLEGSGEHLLGKTRHGLKAGQLLLIRPQDRHAIRSGHGQRLLYVNIAFPADTWRSFCTIAGVEGEHARWSEEEDPPSLSLADTEREGCADAFRAALNAFGNGSARIELCCFWSQLLRCLLRRDQARRNDGGQVPGWLGRALVAMELPDNLRAGLPRLRELCGVSPAYLARTFRRALGQTPTEYLNELRLRRAAQLLRTTTSEIVDVAEECGFGNLSYFYRRFRARHGCPPKMFRLIVGEQIAPSSRTAMDV
jgi:AraC-like DNA-binding protein/quercetin dioxygenase-like cupin family protein